MAKEKLFPALTGAALIDALDANSVSQTTESVDYSLTAEDMQFFASRQQAISERETEVEDSIKAFVDPLRAETKLLKEERKKLARLTKKGYQTLDQRVFWMQDFETKKMLGYDINGDLVKTRPMRQQDAQMTIFTHTNQSKTAYSIKHNEVFV